MKKNVIALAVAAAMMAPLAAQAEVKITGGLQAQVVSIDGDAASADGLYATDGGQYTKENAGNYGFLKFSASEDLGNGLKALAVYNMNISVGDSDGAPVGGAAPGGRDAYVGLSGGFGTVMAGTLTAPYAMTRSWDPLLGTFAQARGNAGMSTWHNSYAGNALAYANKFGMVKVVLAVVLDETKEAGEDATNGDNATSFAVNVPVGPVELAVAYLSATDFAGTTADNTATKVGVKYNAGAITVAAQYEDLDDGSADNTTVTYLAGSYAAGANTFSLGYGITDDGTDDYTYTAIGMKHAFSKSTSVHVAYRLTDVDNAEETAIGAGLRVGF
ncbi:MAG: porin [Gammaproteobacteria bacterium]|nr:porin [Gammaproteobacteria bacterium]